MKILFWVLTSFSLNLITYGQAKDGDQFMFESALKTYRTNDTVRISYDLDSLEILYSNFGGGGGGAVYSIICHSDSLLSRGPQPSYDYLLMEYAYAEAGIVEFVIDSPGIYSVVFVVKNQKQKVVEENRFKQTLSTPKFEIIAKKEN